MSSIKKNSLGVLIPSKKNSWDYDINLWAAALTLYLKKCWGGSLPSNLTMPCSCSAFWSVEAPTGWDAFFFVYKKLLRFSLKHLDRSAANYRETRPQLNHSKDYVVLSRLRPEWAPATRTKKRACHKEFITFWSFVSESWTRSSSRHPSQSSKWILPPLAPADFTDSSGRPQTHTHRFALTSTYRLGMHWRKVTQLM